LTDFALSTSVFKPSPLFYFSITLESGAPLHFGGGGGQFSWNFIRRRHRAYSTVEQLFANGHR